MGIKFNPGLKAAGIDPSMVQKLIDVQKAPVEAAKKRKEVTITEKKEVEKLATMLSDLDTALNAIKTKYNFYKLKLDSSHPDIIDGSVSPGALIGTYEFEVRSLARSEKELAFGFPDKDQTPVGFGYMEIVKDDGEKFEVVVDPGMTLKDVATRINDSAAGVKAIVVNTKYEPEPYRLLVMSEKSGKESRIFIDPDTTYLDFKEQVKGRNLDALFEDVPVTNSDNTMNELIDAVSLTARRSEPGTRVQVSILHDVEETMKSIKTFVEKYNSVATFINGQFAQNPETGTYGLLSGDSSIKYVLRQLQSSFSAFGVAGKKFSTVAEIGITTNSKTGQLNLDENKVRAALAEDYEGVAKLFIQTENSHGIAEIMSDKIKTFRDPAVGAMKSKVRGLERIIENQDKDIARRQKQLENSEKNITRQFTALEGTLADLQSQGDFLKARFAQEKKD
ncbi:MAG: flagellar filament capping protein FliD [Oligoflexales bacterium]|nr:flagellar filament capping protein FliD [Oligoflexales bacterium]